MQALWQVLRCNAAAGLALAAVCGALLFLARATASIQSPLFIAKMIRVAVGLSNAAALHLKVRRRWPDSTATPGQIPPGVRLAAGISLAAWLTVLVLGRLLGYF